MAKYAARRTSKRRAGKATFKRGGKVRRRLFRRKRKGFFKRRHGNGGFSNRTSRRYRSGISAKITTTDLSVDINTEPGDKNVMLMFYDGANLGSSAFTQQQINAYAVLYDLYKVKRMVAEFWLNDNDEYAKPDTQMISMWSGYDPDANSKKLTANSIKKLPGVKRQIMMPGRVYRLNIRPKFTINNKNNQYMFGFNNWMDLNDITHSNQCSNAMQILFEGKAEQDAIHYRYTYYYQFRGRRVGSQYQPTEVDNAIADQYPRRPPNHDHV